MLIQQMPAPPANNKFQHPFTTYPRVAGFISSLSSVIPKVSLAAHGVNQHLNIDHGLQVQCTTALAEQAGLPVSIAE